MKQEQALTKPASRCWVLYSVDSVASEKMWPLRNSLPPHDRLLIHRLRASTIAHDPLCEGTSEVRIEVVDMLNFSV